MDELDYTNKLDLLYTAQFERGLNLKDALALPEVAISYETYRNLDEDLKKRVKSDTLKRIMDLRHEREAALDEAKAQLETELVLEEIRLKRKALRIVEKSLDRSEAVIDNPNSSDFNAKASGDQVIDFVRSGLHPVQKGSVVVNSQPPAPAVPLQAGRSSRALPMPGEVPPADRVDLPTEVQKLEKYPDGRTVQTIEKNPQVLDQE